MLFEDPPREVVFMSHHLTAPLAPFAAGAVIARSAAGVLIAMSAAGALVSLSAAGALVGISGAASAQSTAEPEKPVTPPDSYRVVMENDRMRMIEIHIKAHSKVEVDTPPNRERFLYMLSDGALILAAPGKKPYEFALNAGETAVFPALSPVVENDTDSAVRALMVEIKEGGGRATANAGRKRKFAGKRGTRMKVAARPGGNSSTAKSSSAKSSSLKSSSLKSSGLKSSGLKSKSVKSAASKLKTAKTKHAAKSAQPKTAAQGPKPPLNLSKAAKKKVTGKGRGTDG
jgi:hypothetical protein